MIIAENMSAVNGDISRLPERKNRRQQRDAARRAEALIDEALADNGLDLNDFETVGIARTPPSDEKIIEIALRHNVAVRRIRGGLEFWTGNASEEQIRAFHAELLGKGGAHS